MQCHPELVRVACAYKIFIFLVLCFHISSGSQFEMSRREVVCGESLKEGIHKVLFHKHDFWDHFFKLLYICHTKIIYH